MKRHITLILLLCITAALWGQTDIVKSFEMNPMDLGAQQFKRMDVQGNICALIKVQVLTDNFTATGAVIGDVQKKRPGEYWVYMPGGTKMVKLFSDDFLPILYDFPEPLQGGATYTLVLDVQPRAAATSQPQPVRQGYLLVNVEPATALLELEGATHAPEDGVVKVLLRNGAYTYRVVAPGYFPEEKQVTINGQTVKQTVKLRSSKPTLAVRATTPGTQIYVNGQLLGTGNSEFEVMSGLCEIEGRLQGYRTYTQTVELNSGDRREVVIPALAPIYGSLNVDYKPLDAAITVDGRAVGNSPMVLNDLLVGPHTISISAPDHQAVTLTAEIKDGETATLTGSLTKDDKPLKPFERNGKYGYIDKTGSEVIPLKYDYAWYFSEGLAWVKLNGKYGYIDKTGREVIPPKYDYAESFSEGLALVRLNGKYGYIDKTGSEVIPPKYDYAGSFSEGLAWVKLNGKYGYIDKTGREVIPPKYDHAWSFSEGLALVELNGKYGYIDKTGSEVIPPKYDYVGSFSEGLALVELNGKYGYIDKTGSEVIPPKYDYVGSFSEGLALVKLNGKYGYIDKTGREVIPPKYDHAWSFSEGLALVKLNGKYGYIDKTGSEVIPPKYDYAGPFSEGLAWVELNGKSFYIDKNGNLHGKIK